MMHLQQRLDLKFTTVEDEINPRRIKFLHQLSSSGKLRYKRYDGSPLRYAGGKSRAVGLILEKIPSNIKRLVTPFLGGGSVEVACALELGMEVQGYDIFDVLCNYWQVQLAKPEELATSLAKYNATRETFAEAKARLQGHWREETCLPAMLLASDFYFTFNTSYGPQFLGWPSSVYMDDTRWNKMLTKVRNFKTTNLSVQAASFEQILPQHRDDFLYCDPPYYLDEGKMFIGIYPQRNFPVHHEGFDHARLRDELHSHRGGFLLSYNDCPIIREWYSDFEITTPSWQYSLGQGETRIGANRRRDNGSSYVKQSHELLIYKAQP